MLQLFVHPCPRKVFFFFYQLLLAGKQEKMCIEQFVSQHKGLQGAIVRVCSQNQCFEFPLMCNQSTSQTLGLYFVYGNHINCAIDTVDDIIICIIN